MLPPIDLETCHDRELEARIAMLFEPRAYDSSSLAWVLDREVTPSTGYPHWTAREFTTDVAACLAVADRKWSPVGIHLDPQWDAEFAPRRAWRAVLVATPARAPVIAYGPTRCRALAAVVCAGLQREAVVPPLGDADAAGHVFPPGWVSTCVLCLGIRHEDLPGICPGRQLTATQFAGVASGLLSYVEDRRNGGYFWVAQTPRQPPTGG